LVTTTLLALASRSLDWSPTIGIIMIVCNIVAIAIGKYTIQKPSEGPEMPSANMFGGFGLGSVLGTTSLGHILGAGVILGLSNTGAL
jgi:photosystem I subunit X